MTANPPRQSLPSRSGAIGFLVGGGLLLVIAALCAFVFPPLLVFGPAMDSMNEDAEYYYDYIQSGQTTEIPAGQWVYVQPDWIWMDPAMNPTDGRQPAVPDFSCTITGPAGATVPTGWDEWNGVTVEVTEAGTYTVECDGGGMLNLNGSPLGEQQRYEAMDRNLGILTLVSWISGIAGFILTIVGSYLLGSRNEQRKVALQTVYASVPIQHTYADQPGQAGQSAQTAPSEQPVPSAQPQPTPVRNASDLNPSIPLNSDTYQVRPRVARKSRDPFEED